MGAPIDLVNRAHATEEKKETDCAVTMIEAKKAAVTEKWSWRVNCALATKEEEQTDCDKGFAAKNFPRLES